MPRQAKTSQDKPRQATQRDGVRLQVGRRGLTVNNGIDSKFIKAGYAGHTRLIRYGKVKLFKLGLFGVVDKKIQMLPPAPLHHTSDTL